MSDGAFRRDRSFATAPPHDPSVLESARQRAVLAWFVKAGWLDLDAAAGMLAWPHSSSGVHIGPAIQGEDRDALRRVARYFARAPVAESRLRYDADRAEVELVSHRSDGPYAGIHRFSALEFIARWVDHVPDAQETRVRDYGAYASRCGGAMKVLGFVTEQAVVGRQRGGVSPRARANSCFPGGWWGECARPHRPGEIHTAPRVVRRLTDGRNAAFEGGPAGAFTRIRDSTTTSTAPCRRSRP